MNGIRHASTRFLFQIALAAVAAPIAYATDASTAPPPPEAVADERARAVRELAESLASTVEKHGSDAVGLQAALLMSSLSGGAVLATEVTVIGPSPAAGPEFLRVDVATGLVFDSDTTTSVDRGATLWKTVATPALERLETTDLKPAGLDLMLGYGTQSYAKNLSDGPDFERPFDPHSVRVSIPAPALADLVAGTIDAAALLERCTVVHDEAAP